ncbi:hypothetical protein Q1695_008377 [Nippostrongylus brasiliensis]|nr:hypothetical protein Q1695_008377 [Nippostrongylus brasiliensis]
MNDANITETTTFSVDQVQSIDIFKSRAHVSEAQAIAFLQGNSVDKMAFHRSVGWRRRSVAAEYREQIPL